MSDNQSIQEALQKLADGNKRFIGSKLTHPNQTAERRNEVSKGQKPFAVIVGCSDSRIPPEIIFDQGLGDLFVIRVAGNIVDDIALGSIEYAVDHLGTPLVVVLGHGKCGAVTTTVQGGEAYGHIGSIVKTIAPAVEKAKAQSGDLTDNAIRANVELVVEKIKSSKPILAKALEQGTIKIAGAYYDIETGKVDIII
ncbi:MAG: carbonic anhydrase [Proteobacteria bacterium]|nr:carbonic anhydrase [Pseudomonadota bacterium]